MPVGIELAPRILSDVGIEVGPVDETGVWLSRDPAGFVDGPNLYAYCVQNPWSSFDADGLFLSYLVEKFDEHVANPFGDWVANSVSLETCNAVGNSKVCSAIEKTARVVHSTSKGALDALCPGSGVLAAGEKIYVSDQPITLSQVGDLAKAAVDDFAGKKLKIAVAAGDATVCAVNSDGAGALAAITEGVVEGLAKGKVTRGELPKPPKGRGSVPPSQRDPKRVYTKSDKSEKLSEQGGTCGRCEEPLPLDDSIGHHKDRHADGGRTVKENLAVVCDDCHKELHR